MKICSSLTCRHSEECKMYLLPLELLRRINFHSCLLEAAIQECSQKIIILRSSHQDVLFNITVLKLWLCSLKNTCDGIFSKFACNALLLLTNDAEELHFVTSIC